MKKAGRVFCISLLVLYSLRASPQVVINEIMYHDPTNEAWEEFVELYNCSEQAIDLERWQFTEGIRIEFGAGTVIEPNGFLVLCADAILFSAMHPDVKNVYWDNYTGRLENGGEKVTLCDKELREMDCVEYGDAYPWPEAPDGDGPSLELILPSLGNNDARNWAASLILGGTPGAENSVYSKQPPVANAGEEQFVPEMAPVSLDGTASSDADGDIVSYAWTQMAGLPVILVGSETATPLFEAPEVDRNVVLTFRLCVRDNDGVETCANVSIVVVDIRGEAVSGTLTGSTTWKAEDSPYVITSELTVPAGTTLTIEPGVAVELFPRSSIIVRGDLIAEGTEDNRIVFGRVEGVNERWGRLRFDRSAGSVLRRCTFEYGSKAGTFSSSIPERSGVYVTGSEITVEECTFRYFDDYVFTAEDSSVVLFSNSFYEIGEGINLTNCAARVEQNRIEGVANGDDAIDINSDWTHGSPTPVVIEGNIILRVSGDGIDLGGCSPLISRNLIYLCADKGISLGEGSDPRLENNILLMNTTGIAVKDGSNPTIVNNTVVRNGVGVSYYEKEPAYGGGRGRVINCIVWGNKKEISCDGLSVPNITFSLIGGESVWPGEGNVNENPWFIDFDRNDLRLVFYSPAVDGGTTEECPERDFCGEVRPAGEGVDVGALEASDIACDMDRDGVLDQSDAFALDDRYVSDEDSDGLADEWEALFFQDTPAWPEGDPDEDGVSNREEFLSGTNPTSGAHRSVVINEIHYHPASEDSAEEFIELYNSSSSAVDVSLWAVTDEVLFQFPAGTTIPGNGYVVVASDPDRIRGMHRIESVYGPYARTLSNAFGVVRLVDDRQVRVCEVWYSDAPPWPTAADGDGPSLELKQPDLNPSEAANWTSSWVNSGTPGGQNSLLEGPVVINEFMAFPISGDDWIELYNTSDEKIELSGFYLSDDRDDLTRYRIPDGIMIEAKGFLVLTRSDYGFGLGTGGETIVLTAPDRKSIWSQYHYSDQKPGVSHGRSPDGGKEWYSSYPGTPWETNATPVLTGGVVINEIYYHPESDDDGEEFVEICNATNETIDLSGWSFSDGFTYRFPPGVGLGPGSYLVIGHDPAKVEALFGISGVLGPFEGERLSNRGERIGLYDSLGNLVDSVSYADSGLWPTEPDGDGPSLELINPTFDRKMAACWAASLDGPTPGKANSVLSDNIPPEVVSVLHSPTVPTSSDEVLLQARIVDHDGQIVSASAFFKKDADEEYGLVPMVREAPGSDIYRAVLPAQPDGTLVEFFVWAMDDRGVVSVRPRGAPQSVSKETAGPVTVSYLYIVDESRYPDNMPTYRLLATEENLTEIEARPLESDVLLSAGLVYDNQPFYDIAIRYREANRWRRGIRIELRGSERLRGERKINLSKYHALEEHVCATFYETVGLPVYETLDVRVLMNRSDEGHYLDIERIDENFVQRCFPSDSDGTLLRGGWEVIQGEDVAAIKHLWKETLRKYNDPQYAQLLAAEMDIGEWIRCLAAIAISADWDTLLGGLLGNHMDYLRPSDGRVVLLPFDADEAWAAPWVAIHGGTTQSWRPDPRIENLLLYPPFRRQYYEEIVGMIDNEFAPENIFAVIEEICAKTGQSANQEQTLKGFVRERSKYLEQVIENYIDSCGNFAPVVETNGGFRFFTDGEAATVKGTVLPWSAGVEVFRVEGEPTPPLLGLTNGGFEDGTTGWSMEDLPPDVSASLENGLSRSGSASLKVAINGGNPDYYGVVQVVDCKPLTKYRLSYFIRAAEMVKGNMFVNVIDPDNGGDYLSVLVPEQRQNNVYVWTLEDCDWTYRSGIITTKENTHRLAVRICRAAIFHSVSGDAKGNVWYDDLRLEEIGYGRQPIGPATYDAGSGTWSRVVPLNPGKNIFEFVAWPLASRDCQAPTSRIGIYRSEDSDADGLPDEWEMECFSSLVFGPEDDPEQDGVPNVSEFLHGLNPSSPDTDGDSIPDATELKYGLNAAKDDSGLDLDGDGLMNSEECLRYGTNPASKDTDGDGWTDSDELFFHGTSPILRDTDGDGQGDADEFEAGTDPLDPTSFLVITEVSWDRGAFWLRWKAVPGKRYCIHVSSDMVTWMPRTKALPAEGNFLEFKDYAPASWERRFYRVKLLE